MTLLAAYAYDEGSGTTSADATGNGHTATLNNATFTTGHTGTGITNTASTQGATATVPAITTAAVTLMAWVKPLDLASASTHFACGVVTAGSTDLALWTQRGDFGTSNVLQGNLRVSGNLDRVEGAALTVNTWTHLALTYDGTTVRLYKDGSQVATVSHSGTISLGTTLYVAGAGSSDTDVVVDDVRYYNEVLDATAITAAMNTPVSGGVTDAGTATLALSATGTATTERIRSGTAALSLSAAGTPAAERAASGTAGLTLAASGSPSAERSATGTANVALSATGAGTRDAAASGLAGLVLGGDGTSLREAAGAGTAAVQLVASGVVQEGGADAGTALLALAASGSYILERTSSGTATLLLAASGHTGDVRDITITVTPAPPRWTIRPGAARWTVWGA